VGAFPSKESHTGAFVERVKSVDWKVFLVESFISYNLSLNFAHDWEHVWFTIVIAVSANTQVALAGVSVIFKIGGKTENRIGRSADYVFELVVDKSESLHSE